MTFIGYRKRQGSNAYLFYGEWNNDEVKFPCKITGGTLPIKSNFQNSPMLKKSGKNNLPTLSIYRIFGVSKIHCNLFDFEIQIILLKMDFFYFSLSIVLEKWFLMVCFVFFMVNARFWL